MEKREVTSEDESLNLLASPPKGPPVTLPSSPTGINNRILTQSVPSPGVGHLN